jgi:GDP-mannose 6-dehydrogenase
MLGVVGLGYVGFTSLLGFTQYSNKTIGYDISSKLIDDLKSGILHIRDHNMYEHFQKNLKNLNLTADLSDLSQCTDIIVAVPTEASESGLDLSIVESVLDQIASLNHEAVIWIRSTVDDPYLFKKLSQKYDNSVIFYPEFLREGKCWIDFNQPSLTVIGSTSINKDNFLIELINKNTHKVEYCSASEAITLKLACNSFHALKVCFANEINNLSWGDKIDSALVMKLFAKDDQLNISDAYLKPGLPFGGPCLPKDTFALSMATNDKDNLFSRLLEVNDQHKRTWAKKINSLSQNIIGFIGLEFKPQTGDFKNSPIIDILSLVNNKEILILEEDISKNSLLKSYTTSPSIESMINQADIVITYDRSLKADNIIYWDQL